jgi:hypothetical protein
MTGSFISYKTCIWTRNENHQWESECGYRPFNDYGIYVPSNYLTLFIYCPFCSKKIERSEE